MIGLLAIGVSGDWNVQVDCVSPDKGDGEDTWGMTIDHPRLYLQSAVDDLNAFEQLRTLLRDPPERSGEVHIGECAGAVLTVLVSTRRINFKTMRENAAEDSEYPTMVQILFESGESRDLIVVLDAICEKLGRA